MSDTRKDRRDIMPVFQPTVFKSPAAERQSARQEIEEELDYLWAAQSADGTLSMEMSEEVLHQTWEIPYTHQDGRGT